MTKKHLIIGCGSAGLSALEMIRKVTLTDEVKLVSAEEHSPYSPTSLPYFLAGRISEANLWLKEPAYFEKMGANFTKGKEVIKVAPQEKEVIYRDGDNDTYDTLLIATGAKPLKPAISGLGEEEFLEFHVLADARKLTQQLQRGKKAIIYGGGLVAVELAASLLEMGCQVTVIVRSRLLRTYFEPEAGDLIGDIFSNEGAQILSGVLVSEVERRKDGKVGIMLSSGDQLEADLFVVCTGVAPRVSFLEGTGIKVNTGILVNKTMGTNIEGIYAAGDVAEAPDFFTGNRGINAILPSAVEQGKVAGANMAGQEVEYEGWISMNTFNFLGHAACSIGMGNGEGVEVLREKDRMERRFKRLSFIEHRIVGAVFVDVEADPGFMLYLIKNRVDVGAYKEKLFEQPREVSRWLAREAEKKLTKSMTR